MLGETSVRITADTSGFHQQASKSILGSVTKIGASAAAIFGGIKLGKALFVDPIKSAGDFQQSLNVLQATSNATDAQMKKISATAMKLGADVKLPAVSASDAANAMLELAKGGFTAAQSMDAARGVLLLSTAAEIDGAQAATLVADGLHAFGMRAKDAGVLVDDFAGAANASTASMSDVGLALQQSGQAFHQLKIPVGDAATAIAQMANAGIKGSDAGTSLKTMLMRLSPQTKQAKDEFKAMNVNVFDQNGKFIGLQKTIEQFAPKLKAMTQEQRAHALQVIFGSDASRAANIVLGNSAKSFDALRDKVTKAGQAQKLADAQTKGFNGQVKALQSGLETLQLKIGNAVLPKVTELVKWLGKLTSSPNFTVAIKVVWQGIVGLTKDLKSAIDEALFGKTAAEVPILRKFNVGGDVVVDPGLIEKLQTALTTAMKGMDWSGIGTSVMAGISAAIDKGSTALNGILTAIMNWVKANSGAIADVGLVIGLTMFTKLSDPAFWAAHWQLMAGVALAALTIAFPEGKLAEIGLKVVGFLLKPFELLGTKLGALAVEGVLQFSTKLESLFGPLAGKIGLWIGDAIVRATSTVTGAMVELGAKMITAFINKIVGLGAILRTAFFTAVVTVIGNLVGAAVTAAGKVASGIVNKVKEIIGGWSIQGLLAAAITGPLGVIAGLAAAAAVKIGSRIVKGVLGELDGIGGKVLTKLVQITNEVNQVAQDAWGAAQRIGARIISGVLGGLSGLGAAIKNKVEGALSSALSNISVPGFSPVESAGAEAIGMPIIAGAVRGIEQTKKKLDDAVTGAVTDSVSRGGQAVEGVTKGMTKIFDAWASSTKTRMTAAFDAARTTIEANFAKAQAKLDAWKTSLTPTEAIIASMQAKAALAQVENAVTAAQAALGKLDTDFQASWDKLLADQAKNLAALNATQQQNKDSSLLAENTFNRSAPALAADPLAQTLVHQQQIFDAVKAGYDQGLNSQEQFIAAANALDDAKLAAADDNNAQQLLDQYNTWQAAKTQEAEGAAAVLQQQKDDDAARVAVQAQYDVDRQAALDTINGAILDRTNYFLTQQATAERNAKDAAATEMNTALVARHDRIITHIGNVETAWENHFTKLVNDAHTRGKDFTDAYAEALTDGVKPDGAITVALKSIAKEVANYLKLHSPAKKGPMSDLNTWWTALAPTLVASLDTAMIKGALSDAVTPTTRGFGPGLTPSASTSQASAWSDTMIVQKLTEIVEELRSSDKSMPGVTVVATGGADAIVYGAKR